jgi:Predicted membrane protein
MEMNGVGWIAAIIIGGLAGWLAEMFMKSDHGVFMNIILGIVGAIVLNALLMGLNIGILGTGWIAFLITGFIGACLLILVGGAIRR